MAKAKKKYICTATVEVEAENQDDAVIEVINLMDVHDILWEYEELKKAKVKRG
jgi:hypothetical protein